MIEFVSSTYECNPHDAEMCLSRAVIVINYTFCSVLQLKRSSFTVSSLLHHDAVIGKNRTLQ